MTADCLAEKVAGRGVAGKAMGTVIINLQKTRLDNVANLRIWSRLEDAFTILSELLHLDDIPSPIWTQREEDMGQCVFMNLPYNEQGKPVQDGTDGITLNLAIGSTLRVVDPEAVNFGASLRVLEVDKSGDWVLEELPSEEGGIKKRRRLHRWWIEVARRGKLEQFPIV